jgi:hypothetical protein
MESADPLDPAGPRSEWRYRVVITPWTVVRPVPGDAWDCSGSDRLRPKRARGRTEGIRRPGFYTAGIVFAMTAGSAETTGGTKLANSCAAGCRARAGRRIRPRRQALPSGRGARANNAGRCIYRAWATWRGGASSGTTVARSCSTRRVGLQSSLTPRWRRVRSQDRRAIVMPTANRSGPSPEGEGLPRQHAGCLGVRRDRGAHGRVLAQDLDGAEQRGEFGLSLAERGQ